MSVIATALVKKGRLEVRNRKQFAENLRRLRDGAVLITVERVHATRSVNQNRYYWGVVVELLSDHTGYTPDEIHDVLKAKFIPKRLALSDGNGEIKGEFVIGGSTSEMNKLEFGEFITRIREWAADELDVVIPDPDSGRLWQRERTAAL